MSSGNGTYIGFHSTSLSPDSPVSGYVHERFRPGNTLGACRNISRNDRGHFVRKRVVSEDSFIMTGSRLITANDKMPERRVNVLFPLLVSGGNSDNQRKSQRCTFVDNQKNYFRMKGIHINNVYSLNRNERIRDQRHRQDFEKRSLSDLDLPNLMNKVNRKENVFEKETSKLWRPFNSRKILTGNPVYARLLKGLQGEARIHGHVLSDDVGNRRTNSQFNFTKRQM